VTGVKTCAVPISLIASSKRTGGPSRYVKMADSTIRIGFISPHSNDFCHECNRVRVTVEGQLLLCLGNENAIDLKSIVRQFPADIERLKQAITDGMQYKPQSHHFNLNAAPQILRFMNATGG